MQRTELQIKNRFKALLKKEDGGMSDIKTIVDRLITKISQTSTSLSVISESKGDMSEDEEDGQSDNSDGELNDEEFQRDINYVPIIKSKLNNADDSSIQISEEMLIRPHTLDL